MKYRINFIFVVLLVSSFFANAADETIEKIYKKKVNIYSAEGKRLDKIDASQISSGTPILGVNKKKGLAEIEFSGRRVWIRLSTLRLSKPISGGCPTTKLTKAYDHTSPTSSGLGVICEK